MTKLSHIKSLLASQYWDDEFYHSLPSLVEEMLKIMEAQNEALKKLTRAIPQPEAIGRDEAGYPEYKSEVDHFQSWALHDGGKALELFEKWNADV